MAHHTLISQVHRMFLPSGQDAKKAKIVVFDAQMMHYRPRISMPGLQEDPDFQQQ